MEKQLQDLNNYFALINLKSFCEKYGLSYDFVRQVLTGKKVMTDKFLSSVLAQMHNFEKDQRNLASAFHKNFIEEQKED